MTELEQIKQELKRLHEHLDKVTQACEAAAKAEPTVHTVSGAKITLQPGEHYAGLVLDAATGAPSHHLVLLPGEADNMRWEDAREWAEDHGGTLPTRQEQSLLFANLKSGFKPNWYWSGEQASASSAWGQYFDHGGQTSNPVYNRLRGRAVRRVLI